MQKKIMVRAWEIARAGVDQFGGKASEYIAEALKMAWQGYKEGSHAGDRIEVIVNRDNGKGKIVVIKGGKVDKVDNIDRENARQRMADVVVNTGIKVMDHFFEIEGKRVFRGQQIAKVS